MNPEVYNMMQIHAMNGAQTIANGDRQLAETLRYKGMQDLDNVSQTEALGARTLSGPHLYHGSPDSKPAT